MPFGIKVDPSKAISNKPADQMSEDEYEALLMKCVDDPIPAPKCIVYAVFESGARVRFGKAHEHFQVPVLRHRVNEAGETVRVEEKEYQVREGLGVFITPPNSAWYTTHVQLRYWLWQRFFEVCEVLTGGRCINCGQEMPICEIGLILQCTRCQSLDDLRDPNR